MPRAQDYTYSFMAGLALPAMYQRVVAEYADLERRREFVDGMIAQESQQIANLEQVFKTPVTDSSTLQALLERLESQNIDLSRVGSGAGKRLADVEKAYKQAAQNSPSGAFTDLSTNDTFTADEYRVALKGYKAGLLAGGASQAEADGAANRVGTSRTNAGIKFAKAGDGGRKAALKALDETEQAILDLQQRGPTGIAGGASGQAEVERRQGTAAPEGSTFATEEDAFAAAIASVSDGELSQDDFESEVDFSTAKRVYDAAKASGAYRNDQRSSFEDAMLSARRRLAQLEAQAQEMARPEGISREQEMARKQLEARGYDLSKPYVAQQKSRYYPNLIRADELFNASLEAADRLAAEDPDRFTTPQGMGSVVLPTNRSQTLARDYIAQRWERGEENLSMRDAERQFGKVLKGDDLQEALSFAIAFHKGLKLNVQTPSDADQQMKAQREAADLKESRRQAALRAQEAANGAAVLNAQMEAEQVASVSGMRAAKQESPQATANLYNRLMLQGLRGPEINRKLNEGYSILTTSGITEETREELLKTAGFSQADTATLAVAFAPQIRDVVRNATAEQLEELSSVPVFQQDASREQSQRATRAGLGAVAGTPPMGGLGFPLEDTQGGRRVIEETQAADPGPIEPGELEGRDILLEEDAEIERQRRVADEPPPQTGTPERSANIPPITAEQRAVLEGLDDATLEVLRATGSWHAGSVLDARSSSDPTPAAAPAPAAPQPKVDPTNADYSYLLTPEGDYKVFVKGVEQPTAAKSGSKAHESIARVLRGEAPLTRQAAPAAAPAPAAAAPLPASVSGGTGLPGSRSAQPAAPVAAPAAAPVATPEPTLLSSYYEAEAAGTADDFYIALDDAQKDALRAAIIAAQQEQ